MKSIFQQMYDFEQNFVIDCFWDEGFEIKFGDRINGFTEEHGAEIWQEVEETFRKKLKELKNGIIK